MSSEQDSRETWNGDGRSLRSPDCQLRELQLVELGILREFIRICDANGLSYFLAYGTLLGSIRHRGFIPWDDDIDVTMPRRDYEKFSELSRTELRPGFAWQSYATDESYPNLFGKLLKKETVLRQAADGHLPFEHAVHIDVFPLDQRPDSWWASVLQRLVIRACRIRLEARCKRKAVKQIVAQLTRVIPRNWAIAALATVTHSRDFERSATWLCAGGPYGYQRQSFPSRWFGAGSPQVFEGLVVKGPSAWHEYLEQLYGDYMSLPPIGNRVSHHGVTEVRLGALPTEFMTER